jgi:hypothetical protein
MHCCWHHQPSAPLSMSAAMPKRRMAASSCRQPGEGQQQAIYSLFVAQTCTTSKHRQYAWRLFQLPPCPVVPALPWHMPEQQWRAATHMHVLPSCPSCLACSLAHRHAPNAQHAAAARHCGDCAPSPHTHLAELEGRLPASRQPLTHCGSKHATAVPITLHSKQAVERKRQRGHAWACACDVS